MSLKGLKPVYIGETTTVTAPEGRYFKAITGLTLSATIGVKGGIYEGLAANASSGAEHLDATGAATLATSHDAGIYEMLPTVALAMVIPAGVTVYGNFTEIACGSGDIVMAYM